MLNLRAISATTLLFLVFNPASAQYNLCSSYDYGRSVRYMQAYYLESDNLEWITGDVHFGKLFDVSKDQLLKKCTFLPIPSLMIDYQAMRADSSRSFKELLKPHYQIYSTFLLKHGKLVTLLMSASTIPPGADKITQAFFLEDKETAVLYKAYNDPSICIFYEPALRIYAYLKGERLFYYGDGGALKSYSKGDYLDYYSSYYSTDK